MHQIPSLKEQLTGSAFSSCSQLTHTEVITSLYNANPQLLWDNLIANENDADLVNWFKTNELQNYYYTLALYNKRWISDYQKAHYIFKPTGLDRVG